MLRVQRPVGIEPFPLIFGKTFDLVDLQTRGLSQEHPGLDAKGSRDTAKDILADRGPCPAFYLGEVPLAEAAALGQNLLPDSV